MKKQINKQRNQQPPTEYRGIQLQLRYDGVLFKYHDRQISGVIYKCAKRPGMILKRSMDGNDYFYNNFDEMKKLATKFPMFNKPYALVDKEQKIYSAEFIQAARLFKSIPDPNKLKRLNELAMIFYDLFDEGFYWDGNFYRNVFIDKKNDLRLCDVDSIKPLPPNTTFKDCYQWYWIIDNT